MRAYSLHDWSFRLGIARWAATAVMPLCIGWILLDVFVLRDLASLFAILGFILSGLAVAVIDALAQKGKIDQREVVAGWEQAECRLSPARMIRKAHRRTFPLQVRQKGAIGTNILIRRSDGQGRQGGRKRRSGGNAAKKASSDDGSGGEPGEQPYQVLACTSDQHQQSFFSFQSAARILDCSAKTLRNKVSAGLIPAPIQTAIGPRFTAGQIQALITPPAPSLNAPSRPRGRPRIAQPKKLVTFSHGGDK